MQVTITETNSQEREKFSYIMEVSPDLAKEIKQHCEKVDNTKLSVEFDTQFTKEQVEELNSKSSNTYKDRYGFYEIEGLALLSDIEDTPFYKAKGLKQVIA